jgi:hypothetical protein
MNKVYTFDLGNSNDGGGPVGFVARVHAFSAGKALDKIQKFTAPFLDNPIELQSEDGDVEYLNIFINANNIGLDDILEVEDE